MLTIGDLLKGPNDWFGLVVRNDGDETCIVRRPNGKEERWSRRADECEYERIAGFYKQEVHSVSDMIEALQCLPQDAQVAVADGPNSGPPDIRLSKNGVWTAEGHLDAVWLLLKR